MEHYIKEPQVSHDIESDPFDADLNRLYIFEQSISSYVNDCLKVFVPGKPIVIVAEGRNTSKAVSCAEIVKSRLTKASVHQVNKLTFAKTIDRYEPTPGGMELESIKVTKTVPVMHILLSYESMDASLPGYQKTAGGGGKYGMRKLSTHLLKVR